MRTFDLSRVTGIMLIALSCIVMSGWSAHLPAFTTYFPGFPNLVFNAALLFYLAGNALLVPTHFVMHKKTFLSIGAIIIAFSALSLCQNIFGISLGIDHLFVNATGIDNQPHPGRMSDNTAIAFMLSGIAFVLLPLTQRKSTAVLSLICIFSVMILGLVAFFGYVLNLPIFYKWYQQAEMSFYGALGDSLLGFGLWSVWIQKHSYNEFFPGRSDKNIAALTGIIFSCLILLMSSIVLSVFPHSDELHYQSVHDQIVPAMLLTVIIGLGLLLWQLYPLIKQILHSEMKLLEANSRLTESENRFRSAFDFAAIGMALISPQGNFLRVNASLCNLLGYKENDLLQINSNEIMHEEDSNHSKACIADMLNGKLKNYQWMQRLHHRQGDVVWVSINMSLVSNEQGEPRYFIVQIQNITAEKKAEEQLRHMAYHDALTNLYNRNKLESRLQEILATARRHSSIFALVFLDLDRFKNINDTLGHDAGDMLLQVVAKRLKTIVRTTDIIARIGGDEFVIVLTHLQDVDAVASIVQKILIHMQKPVVIKTHEVMVTTSSGISVFPYDGKTVQDLMKNADLALYRAKDMGRNNYQFCTPEMTSKAQEKMAQQNAVMHALSKNEFEIYYQPKLDLESNKLSGVEALLRWKNKTFTHITPDEIIRLAEETGLIIQLNDWVLKNACEQMKIWHSLGFQNLKLSVNLSARQFKQASFSDSLLQMLQLIQFPTNRLELEITERLIMNDPEHILNVLYELKKHDISIAIDDFGTGYSSLDYLRRFAIDKIKIDRSFIQRLSVDEASASVVTAIIAMANKLGIKTIAEGVETKEQFEFLSHEKCSEIQGYYLSRPIDVDAMTEYLRGMVEFSSL